MGGLAIVAAWSPGTPGGIGFLDYLATSSREETQRQPSTHAPPIATETTAVSRSRTAMGSPDETSDAPTRAATMPTARAKHILATRNSALPGFTLSMMPPIVSRMLISATAYGQLNAGSRNPMCFSWRSDARLWGSLARAR